MQLLELENNMNEDVLTIAYEKAYAGDISILLVTRKTDSGMEIINYLEREEADKVYEILTKNR